MHNEACATDDIKAAYALSFCFGIFAAAFPLSHGLWDKWRARSRYRETWSVKEAAVLQGQMSPRAFEEWCAAQRV